MSAKKKDEAGERQPDLGGPDYSEIEEHVREMMEPSKKSIPVFHEESETAEKATTAPKISKKASKPKPIIIKHHDEPASDALAATIEETNKELKIDTGADAADVKAIDPPSKKSKSKKIVPIIHADEDEPEAEKVEEAEETPAESAEETPEETEETADEKPAEDAAAEPETEEAEAKEDSETEETDTEETAAEETAEPAAEEVEEEAEETEEEAEEEPEEEVVEEPEAVAPVKTAAKPAKKAPEPAEPEEEPEPEDKETAKAVDEITRTDSDAVIKSEDEAVQKAFDDKKPKLSGRIKQWLKNWWSNPIARWATILILLASVAGAGAYPASRYFILNTATIRGSSSLTVKDESTDQPLKNVTVTIGSVSAQTNELGQVRLEHLKLGKSVLIIDKRAYSKVEQPLIIGWGSNPLGEYKLTPVGAQYSFELTDYLSGKPVAKAELTSGDASTLSDDKGIAKINIDKAEAQNETIEVTIKASGYRDEKAVLNTTTKEVTKLKMVASRSDIFVSKRSGKYDVYKIDIDGQNETVLLAGTGTEQDSMVLSVHPDAEMAALVSTRSNKRNSDGFLISDLTLIDAKAKTTKTLADSEKIQIVGWIGNRLIFVKTAAGASAANAKRNRLISYDFEEDSTKEIASSNYFNDLLIAGNKLYFAPSAAVAGGTPAKLYEVSADGTGQRAVLDVESWNLFRTASDKLTIATADKWYELHLGESKAAVLPGPPATPVSRTYVVSPDDKSLLWVDNRDGKGVLLKYDTEKKADSEVKSLSGLKLPVRWLNSTTILYRVNTEQETADYVVSLDGGEPVKVKDVTNIASIDSWYYY